MRAVKAKQLRKKAAALAKDRGWLARDLTIVVHRRVVGIGKKVREEKSTQILNRADSARGIYRLLKAGGAT